MSEIYMTDVLNKSKTNTFINDTNIYLP